MLGVNNGNYYSHPLFGSYTVSVGWLDVEKYYLLLNIKQTFLGGNGTG